jgi:hypothetical protein
MKRIINRLTLILAVVILLFSGCSLVAEEKSNKNVKSEEKRSTFEEDARKNMESFFSTGVMFKIGYFNLPNTRSISGMPLGVAGRFYFELHKYFRLGFLGSSGSIEYGNHSTFSIGYFGPTVETKFDVSFVRFALGFFIGAGHWTNFHVSSVNESTGELTGKHYDSWTFLVSPVFSVEFAVTKSIAIVVLGEFLIGSHLGSDITAGGPTFGIGLLFKK